MYNQGENFYIGGHKYYGTTHDTWYLAGIIDGVRVSNTARYLSAKVPQTAFPHF